MFYILSFFHPHLSIFQGHTLQSRPGSGPRPKPSEKVNHETVEKVEPTLKFTA